MTEPPPIQSVLIYTEEQVIGDGFIQLPFVRSVRHRFPNARITWMCYRGNSVYANILAHAVDGLIDELLENTGIGSDWSHCLPWNKPLPKRHFNVIIDMQQHVKQTLAARNISHDLFISATRRFLFSDIKPERIEKNIPIIQHYLSLLDLVRKEPEVKFDSPPLITAPYREAAEQLLPGNALRVGLVPGAGDKQKAWPLKNFIELANVLSKRGIQPIFFPGPEEKEWIPMIRELAPDALLPEWERIDALRDIKGPVLVAALGERMAAAVSNDCGTAHMLAAGNTPMVVLYGHTNPYKYRPATPKLVTLKAADFGSRDVKSIPVGIVLQALETLLSF